MKFLTELIELKTTSPLEIIDITEKVCAFAEGQSVQNGIVILSTQHTTTALVINEKCAELQKDMHDFLTRIAPPEENYRHNKVASDGRPNTHSHLLSLFMSGQQSIVIKDFKLQLGAWQSLFLIELDGPRELRKVNVTLIGE